MSTKCGTAFCIPLRFYWWATSCHCWVLLYEAKERGKVGQASTVDYFIQGISCLKKKYLTAEFKVSIQVAGTAQRILQDLNNLLYCSRGGHYPLWLQIKPCYNIGEGRGRKENGLSRSFLVCIGREFSRSVSCNWSLLCRWVTRCLCLTRTVPV